MARRLIRFWNRAPLESAPFVHPDDEPAVGALEHAPIKTFCDYQVAFQAGTLNAKKLHLTLLPQPYLGDIENARIVILLLNPGAHANDFYVENHSLEFREALLSTIRQTSKHHIFLDPKWSWTSAFCWWEGKLRGVAKEISQKKYGGRYGCALELLAREIACLEMVPYHSASFGAKINLSTAIEARKAAGRIAEDTERTIIVVRHVRKWNLPDQKNVIKYTSGQARQASLHPNSPGGKAILSALGIV